MSARQSLLKSLKDAMESKDAEACYLFTNRLEQDISAIQKELYELSSFIGYPLSDLNLTQMRDQEE